MKLTTTHKAVVAVILALIAAVVAVLVLRPSRQDLCASEILINGRGGEVNIQTKTVTLSSKAKPVALETMTNDSQILIDQLSRYCREHQAGLMTRSEYLTATEKLIRPVVKGQPPKVPLFKGSIGITGLVDNRPFRKFADDNVGKVVRLDLKIDAGMYNPIGEHFLHQCYYAEDTSTGEQVSQFPGMMDNLFGQRFHLVESEEENQEYELTERHKRILCGPTVEFNSNSRKLTWSSAGPGLIFTAIDGFFRVSLDQMGAGQSYRFEELSGSIADYAAPQD